MPLLDWIAPALAVFALAGTSAAQVETPRSGDPAAEAPPTQEEIELNRDRYRRYTLPVTINGTGPYNFMVDTGAEATVLSRAIADRLELGDRRPVTLVGMASRKETETVAIDALTFGSRSVYVRTAPLVDAADLGPIDGILGLDTLQEQRVLLDFKRGLIAVDDADELGGNRGFEIVVQARERLGQLIITQAKINGVRTAIIVDTGAQASIGNRALEAKLPGRVLGFQWIEDINGTTQVNPIRRAQTIEIGDMRLNNVAMAFSDAEPFKVLGLEDRPALILGLNELRRFERVAIDFKTNRVRFDLPRGSELKDMFNRDFDFNR
ncbi:retroviral-like aspartic protease family protein [Alteriqipengyuania sp. WL0013]|uniref:retroviral-like aspartic protease family protein n=1 Tax=Alteriqipengyuania sp. WL0013 TaxID=3110773 RepID=UPI002C8DECA2|nr:retroviral-like aspartic protease family protein [Alteriqipengyuania sp. WL0013]MEB3416792.1 retroviral-like aspartic protease family protein [Alteriqipengyuania sp. WL0013]